ncbi:MAG TPA: HYR domain-containing protein [Lutibacter sp.]|nr:HYR domain-containing protein [Lutibacter sp.]
MKNSTLLLLILFSTSFLWKTQAQTIPEIFCPAEIVVSNDTGNCSAVVTFNPATATDVEDGDLTTSQTLGLTSGSDFPVGENSIEFSVTDSDANTVTCQFTVTVQDTEVPVLVCGPYSILYDTGSVSNSPNLFFGDGVPIITSVINIIDNFTVSDIIIELDISHSYSGDVAATLTSPEGTSVFYFR